MWHTLLLGGTASIFLAMTAAALFHLRWARRLPSIGEFKPYDQNESSRGNQVQAVLCAETHGRSAKEPSGPGKSELTPARVAPISPPPDEPAMGSLSRPSIAARGNLSAGVTGVLCSVVLAARDEEPRIETTLRRLLAQEGVRLEVIVVDDRSQDGTREILRRLAKEDARVTVKRIEVLPEGGLGKCHGCHL